MLEKIMNKLGWYLEQPQPEPVHGRLDEYKPLSKDELQLLNNKNRIDYSRNADRRKK